MVNRRWCGDGNSLQAASWLCPAVLFVPDDDALHASFDNAADLHLVVRVTSSSDGVRVNHLLPDNCTNA